jgi:hypothetical protein
VHFAGANGQIDPVQDLFVVDAGVEVFDFEHRYDDWGTEWNEWY